MQTSAIAYQSVRQRGGIPLDINEDAKIVAFYVIDRSGNIDVAVQNLSDEVLIIDQTKSFFVDSNNISTSYYDPTVRTTSNTTMTSQTRGSTMNLGPVASMLGIKGNLGKLMRGTNIDQSRTTGYSNTETTYFADLPQISLAPHSTGAMSKTFKIDKVGANYLDSSFDYPIEMNYENSNCKFSVCITYSLDNGSSWDKLVTDFYVNSQIVSDVKGYGNVNRALQNLYNRKPDAISENWHIFNFRNNVMESQNSFSVCPKLGPFINFQ